MALFLKIYSFETERAQAGGGPAGERESEADTTLSTEPNEDSISQLRFTT